jgi:ribonuclease D
MRAGKVAQVVAYMPSNYEALSSNSNTGKKNKQRRKQLTVMRSQLKIIINSQN